MVPPLLLVRLLPLVARRPLLAMPCCGRLARMLRMLLLVLALSLLP